jgi:hypothetical protein
VPVCNQVKIGFSYPEKTGGGTKVRLIEEQIDWNGGN